MAVFEELENTKKTSARQEDISGDQYLFHSLPKEFQIWHNTQYMLEKKLKIDVSTVPDALLNAYMWKAIADATKFAFPTVLAIIYASLKLKLSPGPWGIFLSLLFFLPWVFYTAYHFIFYAKIKAQVVGEVTEKCAKYTSDTFYSTFYSLVTSLIMAYLFIMSILDDIAEFIKEIIYSIDGNTMITIYIKKILIYIYNTLVSILSPEVNNTLEAWLANTYVSVILFTALAFIIIRIFEHSVYKQRLEEVKREIETENLEIQYPVDKAFITIQKWREENGF